MDLQASGDGARTGGSVRLRKDVAGILIKASLEVLGRISKLHPGANPKRYGLEVLRNLSYTDSSDPRHCLDLWRPTEAARPLPVVFFVHGGGFRILSKDTHWVLALMFAKAGYAVCSINYRLVPQGAFPAAFEDTCQAFLWLADNAEAYGLDLRKLAFAGESAGANLITSLALATTHPFELAQARAVYEKGWVPRAILPACGLFETANPERYLQDPNVFWLFRDRIAMVCRGYLPDASGPLAELASPLAIVESSLELSRPFPQTHLCVGTGDPIAEDTYRMARALDQRGVPYVLDMYRDEPHAFHALLWRKAAKECWADKISFLDKHLCV